MKTLQELNQNIKEAKDLIEYIKSITLTISEDEISLRDMITEEERLKDTCDELKDRIIKIIELRLYYNFEQLED